MAIDYTKNVITSGYNLAKINDNFDKIQTALADGLSRSGDGPNQMEADIDLNSNDLLNVGELRAEEVWSNGVRLTPGELVDTSNFATSAQGVKADGAIRFDASQFLTSLQQSQGRTNIGLQAVVPDPTGPLSITEYLTLYNGETIVAKTKGGGQSASGQVITVNGLQFGVPNYAADPPILSTYASRDHVGQFTFVQGVQDTVDIPDTGTTYTATTITHSSIVATDDVLEIGMVIDTKHSPKWSGVITAIDSVTHTVTVSAWYRVDGSSTTGTPSNGTGAYINPTTKLFGKNMAVWFGRGTSRDIDGHGYELDMVFWKAGLGVYYGWDVVAYGDYQPAILYGHSTRWGGGVARFDGGFYSEDTLDEGALKGMWRAGGDYVRPLVKSVVGADTLFTQTAAGKRSANRTSYVVTATSLTVDAINTEVIICNNASPITITLPAATGYNDGRFITITSLGSGTVTVNKPSAATINTLAAGEYQEVLAANNDWQPIKSGTVV